MVNVELTNVLSGNDGTEVTTTTTTTTTTPSSRNRTEVIGFLTRASEKRSSLKQFRKNWLPFETSCETSNKKSLCSKNNHETINDDDSRPIGIVKRMASQLMMNKSGRNPFDTKLLNRCSAPNPVPVTLLHRKNNNTSLSNQDLVVDSHLNQQQQQQKSLQFRGNFQVEETENGIKIQIKQPHLISVRVNSNNIINNNSINDELNSMNKTSIKIYPLKVGRTTVGSCSRNDIQVQGRGIEPEHCFIENSQIILNDRYSCVHDESCFIVTLYPIAQLCAVDGVLIDSPYVLNTGSMICLGESEYYKYNNPDEENLNNTDPQTTPPTTNQQLPKLRMKPQQPTIVKQQQQDIATTKTKTSSTSINNSDLEKRISKVRFNLPAEEAKHQPVTSNNNNKYHPSQQQNNETYCNRKSLELNNNEKNVNNNNNTSHNFNCTSNITTTSNNTNNKPSTFISYKINNTMNSTNNNNIINNSKKETFATSTSAAKIFLKTTKTKTNSSTKIEANGDYENPNFDLSNNNSEQVDPDSDQLLKLKLKNRRQSPSKKFLSKLNKFELLSRGLKPVNNNNLEAPIKSNSSLTSSGSSSGSESSNNNDISVSTSSSSSSSSSSSTVKSSCSQLCSLTTANNTIRQTINLFDEMLKASVPMHTTTTTMTNNTSGTVSYHVNSINRGSVNLVTQTNNKISKPQQQRSFQFRDVKSKSFNCEKDLHSLGTTTTNQTGQNTANLFIKKPHSCYTNSALTNTTTKSTKKSSNKNKTNPQTQTTTAAPAQATTTCTIGAQPHSNHFSLNHIKLNYIDDEDVSQTNECKPEMDEMLDDDDDYDDNVIYEGDSDEMNEEYLSQEDENERDESDGFDEDTSLAAADDNDEYTTMNNNRTNHIHKTTDYTQIGDNNDEIDDDDDDDETTSELVKCRSAPVSPTRHLRQLQQQNDHLNDGVNGNHHHHQLSSAKGTTTTNTSFIYDMNLYNDQNHVLLNNEDEFNKGLMRLRNKNNNNNGQFRSKNKQQTAKLGNGGLNNNNNNNNGGGNCMEHDSPSCNSSASSFASIKLEPLVISEDDKQNNPTIMCKENGDNQLLIPSLSSTSSPSTNSSSSSSSPAASLSIDYEDKFLAKEECNNNANTNKKHLLDNSANIAINTNNNNDDDNLEISNNDEEQHQHHHNATNSTRSSSNDEQQTSSSSSSTSSASSSSSSINTTNSSSVSIMQMANEQHSTTTTNTTTLLLSPVIMATTTTMNSNTNKLYDEPPTNDEKEIEKVKEEEKEKEMNGANRSQIEKNEAKILDEEHHKNNNNNNDDEDNVDESSSQRRQSSPDMNSANNNNNSDDQEVSSISSASRLSTGSQHILKDNYVKAKREREMEQEQAELEKLRLQEILDLCMEFQRQESLKITQSKMTTSNATPTTTTTTTTNNNNIMQTSSTSSSISSSSSSSTASSSSESIKQQSTLNKQQQQANEDNLISSLPKLTSILNINVNKIAQQAKMSQQAAALSVGQQQQQRSNGLDIVYNLQHHHNHLHHHHQQQQQLAKHTNNNNLNSAIICNANQQKQVEKLNKEKCELIATLQYLKQKIQEIEMRQNEAIRELEMERALLDVEHSNELKSIQNDEAKLKHLQQEHQVRLENFNLHTNQIRNEIEMVQMNIKNIENEILILDTTLDTSFKHHSSSNGTSTTTTNGWQTSASSVESWEMVKAQKEQALDDAKRAHEDLEFQLMELEAKYETELEDIQSRLITEQDHLLQAFKSRQVSLNEYDAQQTQMLAEVKAQTELLECERQKLIEQFRKQRTQLQAIEVKLVKLQEEMPSSSSSSNDDSNQTNKSEMENNNNNKCSGDSPSPASSSVSLTSTSNSIDTQPTPSVPQQHQQHHNLNQNHHHLLITNNKSEPHQFLNKLNHQYMNNSNNSSNNTNNTLSPSRCTFMTSSTNGQQTNGGNYMSLSQHQQANARYLNHQQQQQTTSINHLFVNNPKTKPLPGQHQHQYIHLQQQQQHKQQQYRKQLSQSFRDILENTLLINGICESSPGHNTNNTNNTTTTNNNNNNTSNYQHRNQSTCYLNNFNQTTTSPTMPTSPKLVHPVLNNHHQQQQQQHSDDYDQRQFSPTRNGVSGNTPSTPITSQVPSTPVLVNTQLALKFAQLEHTLALTKAENNNLLEQQLQARERELQLLQEEKRKCDDLERQLNEEKHLREKIAEENIKLRDKKKTQARPLTRYLPVRDNNFDLKQHVENSGHQLMNQIDPNTKQPLVILNAHSCRGYMLKMGQKFKTWNKRWFVFDRLKRTLCYYMDRHETKLRGSIYFQSINEVYVDHMRTTKSPDPKSTLVVKTFDRNFYLVAPSSELMRIWVDVIFTGAEGYLEFID